MAYFAVIGLGRFGTTASLELMHLGNEVLGVDNDPKTVQLLADQITQTVVADTTDERSIQELNLTSCDGVVVAIGEDLQASLLTALNLLNIGIKTLWVKASDASHHAILAKLGVKNIIHPEEEMGVRVAQSLHYPMINSYISLGHNTFIVDINISARLHGLLLQDLVKRVSHDVRVLLVKRSEEAFYSPTGHFSLFANDHLVLTGTREALTKLGSVLK